MLAYSLLYDNVNPVDSVIVGRNFVMVLFTEGTFIFLTVKRLLYLRNGCQLKCDVRCLALFKPAFETVTYITCFFRPCLFTF